LHDDLRKPEREQVLIGILTRLADEMQEKDSVLTNILEQQSNLVRKLESTEQYIRRKQVEVDEAHGKLVDSLQHYRSDMLKLVNEQDVINRNVEDLQNVVKTTTFTLDNTTKLLASFGEKLVAHEKTTGQQAEYAVKQQKILQDAINNTSRDFTKLHADTEKRIDEFHKDTVEQLDKFQYETTRRLLLLDSVVNSLQTLLVRTDPELKKKPLIVRMFERISSFFRFKLPFLLKKKK